jgi:hypothetical protein
MVFGVPLKRRHSLGEILPEKVFYSYDHIK